MMNKRFTYTIIAAVSSVILASCLKTQDTCFDGKKNGDETEIDCGGDCPIKCDTGSTTPTPPSGGTIPCQSSVYTNVLQANSANINLIYPDCYYSTPYYYMLRASTSSLTGSNHYIMIHFYGGLPTTYKYFTTTGSSSYPTNNNEVRLRVKLYGTWYYPSGYLYFDPAQGNSAFICNLNAGSYQIKAKINCN